MDERVLPEDGAVRWLSVGGTRRGEGWQFGVDLPPTSLYSVLLDDLDVVAVPELAVEVDGAPHEPIARSVVIDDDTLFFGDPEHEISVVPRRDRTTSDQP